MTDLHAHQIATFLFKAQEKIYILRTYYINCRQEKEVKEYESIEVFGKAQLFFYW